ALAPLALRARSIGSGLAVVAGALAVGLAMGAEGPLFRLAFDHVPGVALFRLPHRYEAWLGPCAALLAAGGLDALGARTWSLRRALPFVGALVVLGVAALFVDFEHFEHDLGPGLVFLAAALLAAAVATARVSTASIGAFLSLLVIVDVTQALPDERHLRIGEPPGTLALAREVLAHTESLGRTHAAMDEFAIGLRAGTRYRFPELRGYQDPLTLRSHERVLAALHDEPQLAAQFGVAYALQGPHYLHGWNRHFLPRDPPGARVALEDERSVTRLPRALPLVYVVPRTSSRRVSSRQDALAHVREVAPAPLALVEDDPEAPLAFGSDLPETARAAEDVVLERDALRFVVDAPSAGYVVVNQAWYPGWVGEVDGVAAPVFRANGFVRALPVPAGRHRVALRFEPADAWTRSLLLGTWLVALLVLFWRRRA
ncbi:MAG: hypothetical protein KC586_06635, partial [Myxococcales bacterium]|nr:hypothetical protein [Myxococcales bacterium]